MNQELIIQIINSYLIPALGIVLNLLLLIVGTKKLGLFVDSETKELKRTLSSQAKIIDELRKENKMVKKALDIIVAERHKIKIPDEE